MLKEAISTDKAPAAIGPYSQGIRAGNLVFVSGQVPVDPAQGKIVANDVEAQAHQVFKNVQAVQGLDLSHVVKTTVFITDIKDFPKVNAIYKEYFPTPCPARTCVEVSALPLGALPEMEAIAMA